MIGAAGAGLIGSAVFTTDPVSGYLPGTPDALTHATRTGMAHNLAAVPVFVGPPGAGSGAGYGQSPRFIYLGGLFQRTSIITGLAWLTALSAQALRQRPAIAAPRHQAG